MGSHYGDVYSEAQEDLEYWNDKQWNDENTVLDEELDDESLREEC